MKKALVPCMLALLPLLTWAQHVRKGEAAKLAAAFFSEASRAESPLKADDLALVSSSLDYQAFQDLSTELFYVFEPLDDDGFVLLSAEEGLSPIIGYSLEQDFYPGQLPPGIREWIMDVGQTIRLLSSGDLEADPDAAVQWASLRSGSIFPPERDELTVDPLLEHNWNQNPWYNENCPTDAATGQQTVVGCVATALAQVLKFWEYPRQGTGFHSYHHPKYGVQSANFGATQYDWDAMPDMLNGPNAEVARLSYQCGVAINMNYGTIADGGSAAYTIISGAPSQYTAEYALEEFFGYSTDLQGYGRDQYAGDWKQLLMDELDAGRPMLYGGQGPGGGHTWVVDGYDAMGMFHMNWGWGGQSNGFYNIDLSDPAGLGTGGGQGGFSGQQIAVVGIQPPELIQPSPGERMQVSVITAINPNPLTYNTAFSVTTNLQNTDTVAFSGNVGAAIFDKRTGEFLKFIEEKDGLSLDPGATFPMPLQFNIDAQDNLLPGQYDIAILVDEGDGWVLAGNANFDNPVQLDVELTGDISLQKAMSLVPGPGIIKGQGFSVNFGLVNSSQAQVTFLPSLALHSSDGTFLQNVGNFNFQLPPLPPGSAFTDLSFSVPQGLDVDPGTYLLVMSFTPSGQNPALVGSGGFENPIAVNVLEAPLVPDPYEHNDYLENAAALDIDLSSGEGTVITQGANIHTGTDYDFFRIDLPAGKDYAVIARVHDVFDNGLGDNFTADVLWSHREDDEPAVFIFDDVHPDSFTVVDGGRLIFQVAPFYTGILGTYELDVTIRETTIVGTADLEADRLKVFPNPASDQFRIHIPAEWPEPDHIQWIDASGQVVMDTRSPKSTSIWNVSGIPPGVYFLRLVFDDQVLSKPLVVSGTGGK